MSSPGPTTALLALAAIAATALVYSTGAAIVDGPTDALNDAVALQPGDNPHTYLDDDGELVIDVTEDNPRLDAEGVNADAFAVEEDLFYVVHNGSEPAEVWIEHDSPAVTFLVRGEPAESGEEPAIVAPGDDAVPVGVEVDTRVAGLTPGDRVLDEISVHARPADPEAIERDGDEGGIDENGDGDETGDDPSDSDDPGTVVTVESPDSAAREVDVLSVTADTETQIDGVGTEPSVDGDASGDSGRAGRTGDDDRTVTEPSNLDPANYAGLVALVAIVLATLFLVRRAPR